MIDLARIALNLTSLVLLWAIVVMFYGLRTRAMPLVQSGRRAITATFVLVSLAGFELVYAFISRDFSVRYVAEHSSRDLPIFYTIAALWGGQAGSLLFWFWLLSLFALAVALKSQNGMEDLGNYALIPIAMAQLFFSILVTRLSDPFETLPFPPGDGQGLNPLLQHSAMVYHPPTLYIGYVGMTLPIAFAVGALIANREGSEWLHRSRRWMLFSWLSLTAGIILGAKWAYEELGWGGYWAWDPVENASLLPWLTATAYLHSVMIQEKRGMLKVWNLALAALTFELCLFGTFLTRSGVISSVHSFAASNLGPFFLGFIALSSATIVGLGFWRKALFKSAHKLDSLLSRESAFLFNNLILVGLMFATLWGTLFPLFSEAIVGRKISVSAPFFNSVNAPLGIALLVLTGIGPLISWKKATFSNFKRNFLRPLALGFFVALIVGFKLGFKQLYPIWCAFGAVFVTTTIIAELYKGTKARMGRTEENPTSALLGLINHNKRRYGGYIIHLGVVLIALGIMGSSVFKKELTQTLKLGEAARIGEYSLRFQETFQQNSKNAQLQGIKLAVERQGKEITTLAPSKAFYPQPDQQPTTEAAIHSTFWGDVYLIFGGFSEDGQATIQVYLNPMVGWIWVGALIMSMGMILALWDSSEKGKRK